jgi:hypothetical protein
MSSFSESRSKSYADARDLVHRVINAYVEAASLPGVSTFVMTDEGTMKPQRTLAPGSIACHYKCDVEKVTERALKEKPDLQAAWWEIAEGQIPHGLREVHLVQKLKSAYRVVDPSKYLRPAIRKGSVESLRRAA